MKVKELIEQLSKENQDAEVVIGDSEYAGLFPIIGLTVCKIFVPVNQRINGLYEEYEDEEDYLKYRANEDLPVDAVIMERRVE